jgi:predicted Zn-dependent peptidase
MARRAGLSAGLTLFMIAATPAHAALDLQSMVKEHTLKNGMKWLIVERPTAPVFTGMIRVKVGGADEEPGYTGLAHLFEHMAFKGTAALGTTDFEAEKRVLAQIGSVGDRLADLVRAGKGETDEAKGLRAQLKNLNDQHGKLTDENAFSQLYQLNGASGLNATTDKDLTSYFVSFPRNRLQLWMTMEAARFAAPVLRDFYTERDVVMEERRMRTDSQPGGALYEELLQVGFTMSPYRWPVVGYPEDLSAMTLERAHAFFKKFYVPGNAVGAIVGDVKSSEVIPMLEKTFGSIPAAPLPPPIEFAEPPARNVRRSTVLFEANPRMMMGFRKPPPPARDDYVFDVIQVLLGEGSTGRLHRRLVLKEGLVQGVGVFSGPGSRFDNLLMISATPLAKAKGADIERVIWEELEKLKTEKVSDLELQKVRNRVSADQARSLNSNGGLAGALTYHQLISGDWRYVATHPEVIASITPEEVQGVARKYFVPEGSVVVELKAPAKKGGQ